MPQPRQPGSATEARRSCRDTPALKHLPNLPSQLFLSRQAACAVPGSQLPLNEALGELCSIGPQLVHLSSYSYPLLGPPGMVSSM